jgi:hypothetical protein
MIDTELGSETMYVRSRIDALMKPLAIVGSALCGVGAVAAFYVILVRLPAIASTKLELLFGTLQGTAVGLLFAIVPLLINLTYMVRRANRPPTLPLMNSGRAIAGQPDPSAA